MRVRMKTLSAGPTGVHLEGQVYDLPDAEARDLIATKHAEAVDVEDIDESEEDDTRAPEPEKPKKSRKKAVDKPAEDTDPTEESGE